MRKIHQDIRDARNDVWFTDYGAHTLCRMLISNKLSIVYSTESVRLNYMCQKIAEFINDERLFKVFLIPFNGKIMSIAHLNYARAFLTPELAEKLTLKVKSGDEFECDTFKLKIC